MEASIHNSMVGTSFNTLRVRLAQLRRDYFYTPCKKLTLLGKHARIQFKKFLLPLTRPKRVQDQFYHEH